MSAQSASGGSVLPGPVRVFTDFAMMPIAVKGLPTMGAWTGTAGDINLLFVPGHGNIGGVSFEAMVHGTQTILAPVMSAGGDTLGNGLNIGSQDQTGADGIELDTGITAANPLAFVVGTAEYYLIVEATIEDASGADPFLVGFRKLEARTADFNDYNDFAALANSHGLIKTHTIKTNAATVVTDTTDTWADGAKKRFGVFVHKDGTVTYQVTPVLPTPGPPAQPTTVAAYTFTAGLTIIPTIQFLQHADIVGTLCLSMFDCGFL